MHQVARAFLRACALCTFSICAVAAGPDTLDAQAVAGHVLDAATDAPVADVTIRAIDGDGQERMRAVTDSAGNFMMRLRAGRYRFEAEHIGYRPLSTPAVELRRRELVTIEIRVGVAPVEFEPLVVRSRQPNALLGAEVFHRRMARQKAMGIGRFITREEIEEASVISVNDLLARQPSVRIVPIRGRTGTVDAVMLDHAGRRCLPALYLDGVLLGWTSDTDLRDIYQPDMLEGVEIYRSEVETPPELRREGCGAVALWTRGSRGNPFTLRQIGIAAGIVAAALLMRSM
jgi:hypothetical protein